MSDPSKPVKEETSGLDGAVAQVGLVVVLPPDISTVATALTKRVTPRERRYRHQILVLLPNLVHHPLVRLTTRRSIDIVVWLEHLAVLNPHRPNAPSALRVVEGGAEDVAVPSIRKVGVASVSSCVSVRPCEIPSKWLSRRPRGRLEGVLEHDLGESDGVIPWALALGRLVRASRPRHMGLIVEVQVGPVPTWRKVELDAKTIGTVAVKVEVARVEVAGQEVRVDVTGECREAGRLAVGVAGEHAEAFGEGLDGLLARIPTELVVEPGKDREGDK